MSQRRPSKREKQQSNGNHNHIKFLKMNDNGTNFEQRFLGSNQRRSLQSSKYGFLGSYLGQEFNIPFKFIK